MNSNDNNTTMAKHWLLRNPGSLERLPIEIRELIGEHLQQRPSMNEEVASRAEPAGERSDPSVPPTDPARCPFLALPRELRAGILAEGLPAKGITITPTCGENVSKDPKRKPKRNKTSDLMLINKEIKGSVTLAVYQEREFEIHVHQGTTSAGLEFLDAGRQKLHYLEESADDRFERFARDSEFGFRQLKKIHIKIYQPEEGTRSPITTIHTYFMHQALCRLLERNAENERDRIVSITISFPKMEKPAHELSGRQQIMASEHYWWQPIDRTPRSTCLNGLSDVELVLRPFSRLTKVHNVFINLPNGVKNHPPSIQFKDDLIRSMTCRNDEYTLPGSEILEMHVEAVRSSSEEFLLLKKYGGKEDNVVSDLGEGDMLDGVPLEDVSFEDDESESPKRDRSPSDGSSNGPKRQKCSLVKRESTLGLDIGNMGLDEDLIDGDYRTMTPAQQWNQIEQQRAADRAKRLSGSTTLGATAQGSGRIAKRRTGEATEDSTAPGEEDEGE